MDTYTATMIAEGVEPAADEEQYLAAWQHLIDTRVAFQLQGWFGRRAWDLINAGACTPPPQQRRTAA